MSKSQYILKLTPEQKTLIPIYVEKWKKIAYSTERIDRQSASEAIKVAYASIDAQEPKIIFFESPHAALDTYNKEIKPTLQDDSRNVGRCLTRELIHKPENSLSFLQQQLKQFINQQTNQNLRPIYYSMSFSYHISTQLWACYAWVLDFAYSVLGFDYEQKKWEALQLLIKNCGWILAFKEVCLVCDRPIKLLFKDDFILHAEGEPAVLFSDGYKFYIHNGIQLPEKYGEVPPSQWQTQWILEENHHELKELLIKEIGYARICQELPKTKIDSSDESTLLKIGNKDDKPIYVLKKTSPTGETSLERVSPDRLILKFKSKQQNYLEKWKKIAYSTERIDRQSASEAIKAAYTLLGAKEPKILFFDSPRAAIDNLNAKIRQTLQDDSTYFHRRLEIELIIRPKNSLLHQLKYPSSTIQIKKQKFPIAYNSTKFLDSISIQFWARYAWKFDFDYSVLGCYYVPEKWETLQLLIKNCGWILAFKEVCLVCDRPIKLSFKDNFILHAEGEPAVLFSDGHKIYAYNGIKLPKKYGEIHPSQWQTQWLLEEHNTEIRESLIQGIGYARICQELPVTKIDSSEKYTLLKVATGDLEPICLVTQNYSATEENSFVRVPPNTNSTAKALPWL